MIRKKGTVDPQTIATTDVLYDDDGNAHHRTRKNVLLPHDQAHHEDASTVVKIRQATDQIVWIADDDLEVVRIVRHDGHGHGHGHDPATGSSATGKPVNPFEWDFPRTCQGTRMIATGPTRADAALGRYKVTFKVGGRKVDPDVDVTPHP